MITSRGLENIQSINLALPGHMTTSAEPIRFKKKLFANTHSFQGAEPAVDYKRKGSRSWV